MKNKDIQPCNSNGDAHGLWTRFHDGNNWYKGNYVNGKPQGFWVSYMLNAGGRFTHPRKTFFII